AKRVHRKVQDRHACTLEIGQTWPRRTETSYVRSESVAVKEARGLDELPLGASDAQLPDHEQNRDWRGERRTHEIGSTTSNLTLRREETSRHRTRDLGELGCPSASR